MPDKAAEVRRKEIPLLEQTTQQHPRDAVPFALLANLYAANGEREKALASLRTALALAPEDPTVLGDAADVYEHLGDRREVAAYIEKALKHGGNKEQFLNDPELRDALNDSAIKALLK
jgi:cytochrome c-type biogenesis protein CcmH/NrfG